MMWVTGSPSGKEMLGIEEVSEVDSLTSASDSEAPLNIKYCFLDGGKLRNPYSLHFQPISQDFNSFLLQMPELHLNFTFWFVECGRCQRQKDILRFLDFCTHISVSDKQKQISYEHHTDGKGPTYSLKLVLLNPPPGFS